MTPAAEWTSPDDIIASVRKLWDTGRILAARIGAEAIFPRRLPLRAPDSSALAARFGEVQAWIQALQAASRAGRGFGFDLVWREVRHPQLGRNTIPSGVIVPSEEDALRLIGAQAEADRFDEIAAATAAFPQLLAWLQRRPLTALDHARDWPLILAVIAWFRENPGSGLYLRQLDIAGVDTKFIEARRGILAELLDLVLAGGQTQPPVQALGFEARYGLRSKPATVRFRLLDGSPAFGGLTDICTPAEDFARLDLSPRIVFITENEINGRAFPPMAQAMVLFGLGYGLDLLAKAQWLARTRLVYWGDIDTHGFAMLARLRTHFPAVQSLLMDEATLLAHQPLWVREERPFTAELPQLSEPERRLFDDLKHNRFGPQVRLEQERIAYSALAAALEAFK